MPTRVNSLPNELQLKRSYWGTEAVLGTLVPPTYRMYCDLALNKARPLADRKEFAGTRFKDYTPVRQPIVVDGTCAQALSYEDLPILARYGIVGGGTGVTDGNTTPGYTYTQAPSATKPDIDYASGEYGFPGMPETFTGLHHAEFTIAGDIDNTEACWTWNSRVMALTKDLKAATTGAAWTANAFQGGYVRMTGGTPANLDQFAEIASNTTTTLTLVGTLPAAVAASDTFEISGVFTPGIADRTRETISMPNTLVYMDQASAIGTTQVKGRVISFSVTWANNSFGKRFAENATGFARYGFGAHVVTGQVRLEFDHRKEYDDWMANTAQKIRIRQTGTTIDSVAVTTKFAQIDIPNAQWDAMTEDARQENVTVTLTFRAYVDPTSGVPATLVTKNRLATLP